MWFAKQPYRTIQLEAFKLPTLGQEKLEFNAVLSVVVHRRVTVNFGDLLSGQSSMTPVLWIDENIFNNINSVKLPSCSVHDDSKIIIASPHEYPGLKSSRMSVLRRYHYRDISLGQQNIL